MRSAYDGLAAAHVHGTMLTTTAETTKPKVGNHKVYAAGAVLWQFDTGGDPQIGLIHRPRYDDWSLPKGKLNRGETEPVAAVREILEETGQHSALGRRLALIDYPIPRGTKFVRYWAARGLGGEFRPCKEVDQLLWVPVSEAATRLTHLHDRKVLRRFAKKAVATQTVLIVSQAAAVPRARHCGEDRRRPLDKKGRAQAESLVPQMLAFGATNIYAGDGIRCVQTVEPLARKTGLPISVEPTLTDGAYAEDPRATHQRTLEIAALGGTPVICSQGRTIPDLIQWWCERDGVVPDQSRNRKGSTWVLSLRDGRLIAADHLAGPRARG